MFSPARLYGGPGKFGFDQAAHLTEKSELITAENRERLFQEWSRYWDLSKPCLLEKSPPNLIRTRFIQALFPGSSFVVILRHPVAVSLATSKWTTSTLESLVQHWLHCHHLFESDRPHLRNVHILKYEDLIGATEQELKKLFQFLGLPSHGSPALNPAGNHQYFESWQRLADAPQGRGLARTISSKYEDRLRSFGYSFSDCMPPAGPKSSQSALTLEKN